jgi:hypothetical protein
VSVLWLIQSESIYMQYTPNCEADSRIVVRPEVQTSAGLPSTPNDVFPTCASSVEEKASLAPLNKGPVLNPYIELTLEYF